MTIELRNAKHGTMARFRVSHSGQTLEKSTVTRLRKGLCPAGCCAGRLPQSGPRHKTARQVIITQFGGEIEVWFKNGVGRETYT